MARAKEKAQERKVYVTIRSPMGGKKEKFETWRYWEIVGALQWMGTERQLSYDAARWLQRLNPGDSQTLPNGITMEVSEKMIVYCDCEDCKNNKDRMCEKTQPVGTQFITVSQTLGGQAICDDYEPREEDADA